MRQWKIAGCTLREVQDFDGLLKAIEESLHPVDLDDFQGRYGMPDGWTCDDAREMVERWKTHAEDVDMTIHLGMER